MWEFQICEMMLLASYFFACCLVSWKDVILWFSTHMLLQDENHILRQERRIPYFKMDKRRKRKIQGAIYFWACSTPWLSWHIFGGSMFLCGIFHWGSCIPRTWASVMGGGKLLRCQPTERNAQLRDGVNEVCWPICHGWLSFQSILGWSQYNVGWSYHNGPPKMLLADTSSNYTPL